MKHDRQLPDARLHLRTVAQRIAVLCMMVLLISSCRDNPFESTSTVTPPGRTLEGTVLLPDQETHEGAYVWLDGINVGTSTDADGHFRLTLPPSSQIGGASPVNGVFSLYSYVGNYAVASTRVGIRNGELVLPTSEFDERGVMLAPRRLMPLFSITTRLSLTWIEKDSLRFITIHVLLQSSGNPVQVYFPRRVNNVEGPLFFYNMDTGEIFLLSALVNGWVPTDIAQVGPGVPYERILALTIKGKTLTAGRYQVIPYLHYRNQYIPPSLFGSLGANADELANGFVKIPYRRTGDVLTVVHI